MGFDVNMGSDACPSFFSGDSLLVSSFAMLIDMDFSGALFFFVSPTAQEKQKNAKRKNVMIFLILLWFFSTHSFMSFTKWLFFRGGSFSLQGVFSSNFGRFFSVFTVFFALGVGVWKFALSMCILGFSFSHFLF